MFSIIGLLLQQALVTDLATFQKMEEQELQKLQETIREVLH